MNIIEEKCLQFEKSLEQEWVRRFDFINLLNDLAQSQIMLETEEKRTEFYKRLEKCYHNPNGDNYRHYYSDIFLVLTSIKNKDAPGDIQVLGQNIQEIHSDYRAYNFDQNGNLIDIRDSINKLYDHVSLDIARLVFSDAGDRETRNEAKIDEVKRETNSLSDGIMKAQKDLGETKEELKKTIDELRDSKKEYISILGIFSSVVLTFTAGIAFSTSVLQNIHQASVYRLVLGVLLIAFVLINVIFLLFHYVDKMVHGEDTKGLAFIKWIDLAMVIAMVIVVASWFFGVVEWRNGHYNDEPATPTIANMTEEQLEEKIEEILNETMENTVDVDITINGESENVQNKEVPQTGE